MVKKKYKTNYNNEEGVWRTIGGRRVFIRTGQDLSSAMRDSGKFKRMKEEKEHYREMDEKARKVGEQFEKQYQDEMVEARRLGREDLEKLAKEKRKENMRKVGDTRLSIKKDWEERLAGKEYISDYPEAYRHYEKDWESTQDFNDDIYVRKEFNLHKQPYPNEEDYLPGGKRWNKEWESSREAKVSQEGLNRMKNTKGLKTWDSVEDRYNKDKSFRDMLKNEHQKTMDYARKDIGGYLDDTEGIAKQFGIQNKDDLYNYMNKNYYSIDRDDFDKIYSEEAKARYDKVDKEWVDLAKKMEDYYNENGTTNWVDEAKLNKLSKERDSLSIYRDNDWREQVKKNNELMEKELKDYESKHDISREPDEYYEIFRNNERRNAKIKKELPDEIYEYVPAYAGYREKSYKLAGTKMSGEDVVEYGRKSWTGKEYTNDEFMEHLEDSNWHSERRALLEAGLTNSQLEYIKNKTTLSQWGVGEELTGIKNVEKMIKEAKNNVSSTGNSLQARYKGTVEYLQKTTNMSGAEILELLKKIDKDRS